MRTIYIDDDFKCHVTNSGSMTAVDTEFFDDKCETFIEGYRYVPEGKTWRRGDGVEFTGEMITPITDHRILAAAQVENDKAQGEITTLAKAGAEQVHAYCSETGNAPKEDSGVFIKGVAGWETGKTYAMNDLFSYNGAMGYVKQLHTAQETWTPFSVGTESLYGARPAPDADGIYPYVYNMAAAVGMKVRDDGTVFVCVQAISDMLYKPSQLPAHFEVIENA